MDVFCTFQYLHGDFLHYLSKSCKSIKPIYERRSKNVGKQNTLHEKSKYREDTQRTEKITGIMETNNEAGIIQTIKNDEWLEMKKTCM